jgi:hypothetical protein
MPGGAAARAHRDMPCNDRAKVCLRCEVDLESVDAAREEVNLYVQIISKASLLCRDYPMKAVIADSDMSDFQATGTA